MKFQVESLVRNQPIYDNLRYPYHRIHSYSPLQKLKAASRFRIGTQSHTLLRSALNILRSECCFLLFNFHRFLLSLNSLRAGSGSKKSLGHDMDMT